MSKTTAYQLGRLLIFGMLMLVMQQGLTQQRPQFTHYMYNTLAINPAYAGSREVLSINAISRHQWVGLEGAPMTQTITAHTPIFNQNIGLGVSLVSDRIGPDQRFQGAVDFAYRMRVSESSTLSFGMKVGAYYRSSRLSELVTIDDDASFTGNLQSKLVPNVGVGAYYVHPKFYAGLSIPNLLESDYYKNQLAITQSGASERRHYYMIVGSQIWLGQEFEWRPSAQIKLVQDAPVEVDLTSNFILYDKFWFGAMYRFHSAAGILAAVSFTEQLRIGYAFDMPLTRLRSTSIGTHEIMLTYEFKYTRKAKIRSPRYY